MEFEDFDRVSIPIWQLGNLEQVDIVDKIDRKIDNLSEYKLYVEVDDFDDGNRYMYCYNIYESIDKFRDDLGKAMDEVVNNFVDSRIEHAVNEYNSAVQKELKNKIAILLQTLPSESL